MFTYRPLIFSLLFVIVFVVLANNIGPLKGRNLHSGVNDRIVLSPTALVVLAFGDRYLPANLEVMRLASTGMKPDLESGQLDGKYLLRALTAVSELNPCHEDNYYFANAIMAWGGGHEEANYILKRAMECRSWDFLPAFLYGFNKYFFDRDLSEAAKAFRLAAKRSNDNAVVLQRLAIMAESEQIDDERLALEYLKEQSKNTDNPELQQQLQKRMERLEGLILLRNAQRVYEKEVQHPLEDPQQLVIMGYLDSLPQDPLGLGYEYTAGKFSFRTLNIGGVKRQEP